MKVYVNAKNEIKDVGTTNNASLKEVEINDENNPFANWSIAKICCYKVNVENGIVRGYSPYVDIKIVEHIDRLALDTQKNMDNIATLEATVVNNI